MVEHGLDHLRRAFDVRLDGAVPQVPDRAGRAEPGGLAGGVHPEAHALDPSAHAHDASDPLLVLLRAHSLSPPVSAAAAPAAASTSSLHCQSTISGASSPCS